MPTSKKKSTNKVSRAKKKLSSKRSNSIAPKKSKDIPVTKQMLFKVREELKADFASNRHEIKALEKNMKSGFKNVDARFEQLESKFEGLHAEVQLVHSEVAKVLSAVHRVGLLVEEQNARNNYVLDGYTALSDRLDRHEIEIAKLKKSKGEV